jgi:hypothetical protein
MQGDARCSQYWAHSLRLKLFRIETACPEAFVRSKINGITLIELLIVMILISGAVTAYLNFQNEIGKSRGKEPGLSFQDSVFYGALDIMANDLLLARKNITVKESPLAIEHLGNTDKIRIRHGNYFIEYLIDAKGRFVKQTGNILQRLTSAVVSFKLQELGKQTIILTLSINPHNSNGGERKVQSYSRVVTVNFPLQ